MRKMLAVAMAVAFAGLGAGLAATPAQAALAAGASAPAFTTDGSLAGKDFTFVLGDALKKGPVVIYFFPAAYTQGCTIETKMFADAADEFTAAGASLIGLTAGARLANGAMADAMTNKARLAEFSKEHCRDKFPIAAVGADTIKAYDVAMALRPGWSDRTSYVIAPDGKVLLAFSALKPDEHVAKTLEAVKAWKAAKAK